MVAVDKDDASRLRLSTTIEARVTKSECAPQAPDGGGPGDTEEC